MRQGRPLVGGTAELIGLTHTLAALIPLLLAVAVISPLPRRHH
ncbi:MAG TPA: hypothetical protein VFU43_31185 [Streptosporangiaceae bacterium]|nr:hypothetical protein [Streptosporangiaceae bacterium]